SMKLTAQAVDFGGNIGTSPDVTVMISRDIVPPTVSLDAPLNGSSFVISSTITLSATASDAASGVAPVDFLANGLVIGSATAAPYQMPFQLPATATSITFVARAYDRAGNFADSQAATVTVFAHSGPTVSFTTAAGPGGILFGGGELHMSATAT